MAPNLCRFGPGRFRHAFCTLLPSLCRRSVQALQYYRLDRSAAQTYHTDHDHYQTRHIHSVPVTSLYALCVDEAPYLLVLCWSSTDLRQTS